MTLISAPTEKLPEDRILFLYKVIASGTAGEDNEIKFDIMTSPSETGFALSVAFPDGSHVTETLDLLPELKRWVGSIIALQKLTKGV